MPKRKNDAAILKAQAQVEVERARRIEAQEALVLMRVKHEKLLVEHDRLRLRHDALLTALLRLVGAYGCPAQMERAAAIEMARAAITLAEGK